jgi:hypothetical protein
VQIGEQRTDLLALFGAESGAQVAQPASELATEVCQRRKLTLEAERAGLLLNPFLLQGDFHAQLRIPTEAIDRGLDLAVRELRCPLHQRCLTLIVPQARNLDGVLGGEVPNLLLQLRRQPHDANLLLAGGLRDAQRPLCLPPG